MKKAKQPIYLDYAATTPVDPRVLRAMEPYFYGEFGNASSLHFQGQKSAKAVDKARSSLANFLSCKSEEIVFTSGATESNNTAIKCIAYALKKYGNHIITSKIEHPSVLESCKYLEKQGFKITYLPVYKNGIVKASDVKKAITKKTILISIMYVNNEIGTIQPIAKIGEIIKKFSIQHSAFSIPLFHCDATQAVNYLDCNVSKLGVDLLSLSAHKIYGPKGVGALYVRKNTPIEPFMHGGHQEYGLRAGTINHAGIVGFSKAIEIVQAILEDPERAKRVEGKPPSNSSIKQMRDELINKILKSIPDSKLNGDKKMRVPNNVNISFDNVEGESLLMLLDFEGIAVSTGSACASDSLEPSYVLMALGKKPLEAHGSIRITLGRFTKKSDIKKLLAILPKAVERLRKISINGK